MSEDKTNFLECPYCMRNMAPLSDYGRDGAEVRYRAWVCVLCQYTIRMDNGEISFIKGEHSDECSAKVTEKMRGGRQ